MYKKIEQARVDLNIFYACDAKYIFILCDKNFHSVINNSLKSLMKFQE